MIKLNLTNDSSMSIGGGWTFRSNLKKGISKIDGIEVVDKWQDADVCLLAGATMVTRDTVKGIKNSGKKLILRLDNIPRNSRNRNTGTSRLKDFSDMADALVYQCQWAKSYLMPFLKKNGVIIYNGVDKSIFKKDGPYYDFAGEPVYIYSRFNRDENKRWEQAWYKYQLIQDKNPDAKLIIVGKFSPNQVQYNFDFYRGERFEYRGIIESKKEMAKILRGCDYFLATYYNDAYSNTYLEAMACGVELFEPSMTGGTPELLKVGPRGALEMAREYVEVVKEVVINE